MKGGWKGNVPGPSRKLGYPCGGGMIEFCSELLFVKNN